MPTSPRRAQRGVLRTIDNHAEHKAGIIQAGEAFQAVIEKRVRTAKAQNDGNLRKPMVSDFRHAVVAQLAGIDPGKKQLDAQGDGERCEEGDGKGRHGFQPDDKGTICAEAKGANPISICPRLANAPLERRL